MKIGSPLPYLRSAVALAAMLPMVHLSNGTALAQNPPPGGRGPVKVLLVTKGHAYDRAPFFAMFDALGETITWTHVEQPAAQAFWDPRLAADYDVFVYYDAYGRGNQFTTLADGTQVWEAPPPQAQANFAELLRQGKGMVFFHHALSAWAQSWPRYSEVMGGVCDWAQPVRLDGAQYPLSGFRPDTEQRVTIVEPDHPITQGLRNGFEITDETYHCPYLEDRIHPLLRTDFVASAESFPAARQRDPEWNPPTGSNIAAWYKSAENSPIVYIQFGHGPTAWANESFLKLMENAIRWAASDEALAWARANPQRIF